MIGLGALPARVRLKMVLTGGGARRSDAIELVLDDELCVLLGDGACSVTIPQMSRLCATLARTLTWALTFVSATLRSDGALEKLRSDGRRGNVAESWRAVQMVSTVLTSQQFSYILRGLPLDGLRPPKGRVDSRLSGFLYGSGGDSCELDSSLIGENAGWKPDADAMSGVSGSE